MKDATKLFANKSELEAAQKKVAQLEAENSALKRENTVLRAKPLSRASIAATSNQKPTASHSASHSASPTAPKPKTLTRAQFQNLSDRERMDFCLTGGRVTA